MGSTYVEQTVASAYGDSYTVRATITWNSSYVVTVNASCSNSSYVYGWRIRGRASQGDSTVYLTNVDGTTFQATAGKDYVFQGVGGNGNYSDGAVFTVTDDSGSSGDSGDYGDEVASSHIINIIQGDNTELTVKRTYTDDKNDDELGELQDGDKIYPNDQLVVTCVAASGYKLNTYTYNNNTFNFTFDNLTEGTTFDDYHYYFVVPKFADTRTITISSSATPETYTLSFSEGEGYSITVKRTKCPNGNESNQNIENGNTIYYDDVLEITCEPDTGYKISSLTVNGDIISSGDSYTVTGDTEIVAVASVLGLVHIGNGTNFETYQCYIGNGTSWELCAPYIGDGTNWNLMS